MRISDLKSTLCVIVVAAFFSGCSMQNIWRSADAASDQADDEDDETPALPSSSEEIELLEEATDSYDRGLYSVARASFRSLEERFPTSFYTAFAELKAADAEFLLSNFPEALEGYQDFLRLHPKHESVSYVMLQIAESHRLQYKGPSHDQTPLNTAIQRYQAVIEMFPSSSFALLAKRGIVACREQLARHEFAVAEFYLRQEEFSAAAHRFKRLLSLYEETEVARQAEANLNDYFAGDEKHLDYIRSRDAAADVAIAEERKSAAVPEKLEIPVSRQLPPPPVSPGERPVLLSLACDSTDASELITLVMPQTMDIKTRHRSFDGRRITRVSAYPLNDGPVTDSPSNAELAEADDGEAIARCSASDVDARAVKNGGGFVLILEYPESRKHRLMVLDQPDRLVSVIFPSS
jgi:outer membrane protein assembly factor BamD